MQWTYKENNGKANFVKGLYNEFLPKPAQYLEGHVLPSPLKGLETAHQALHTFATSLIPLTGTFSIYSQSEKYRARWLQIWTVSSALR